MPLDHHTDAARDTMHKGIALPRPLLLVNGRWREAAGSLATDITDPATGQRLASYASPSSADLDELLAAAGTAFPLWRATPAQQRGQVLHRAAALIRERVEAIAQVLTTEQGKPLAEARGEVLATADMFGWCADEALRAYGRVVPARTPDVRHLVLKEPVGPVAAFTAWNFPARNPGFKMAAALAAGCSCIIKPAEETPLTCLLLGRALQDAGLPPGVLGIAYGDPARISEHLVASPVVRKLSLTGSTRVGKLLAGLAAQGVKKLTLELGGHAPVIVCSDADLQAAVRHSVAAKFRNAGQQCIAPSRFYVQQDRHDEFVALFRAAADALRVGDGRDAATTMGPVVSLRRRAAMAQLVDDALAQGATLHRPALPAFAPGASFMAPSVLGGVPDAAAIMREEPFGPVAAITPFATLDEVVARANSLPYGLAGYAFTGSPRTAHLLTDALEVGMLGLNTCKVSGVELPFGGVKESGYGVEGGQEALDAYVVSKTVSTQY
jgi:succinate-semialdehyde dehydrogenase/glutarate-semialdehyde dehydrogenase